MQRSTLSAVIAAVCFSASAAAVAENQPKFEQSLTFDGAAATLVKQKGKLDTSLAQLADESTRRQSGRELKAGAGLQSSALPVVGDRVVVDAVANGNAQQLLSDLQALGLQNPGWRLH